MSSEDLARALREAGIRDVRGDRTTRHAYSGDASLYRLMPLVVAAPRSADEVRVAVEVCRERGVPLTARGGGTSVAGNAVGTGVILDFSRHMNQVIELDHTSATAVVEPGVILSNLQRLSSTFGLRFGPDPSTSTRCTIGGMIGNDACGTRSLVYGRTADNLLGLSGVTGAGDLLDAGRDAVTGLDVGAQELRALITNNLALVRTEFGRFRRQVSGFALQHLLPENGFDVARLLVGSEGTLAVVTRAVLALQPIPQHTQLVVLGFEDFPSAGDAAPVVAAHGASACEGLDARLVGVLLQAGGKRAVPALPRGNAWLLVEFSGSDAGDVQRRVLDLVRAIDPIDARVIDDPAEAAAMWQIRKDGAGLAGRAPSGRPAWAGWEDAAVPPANLGSYLRDLEGLLIEYGLTAMPFGHFGEGCLHIRLDFDLGSSTGRTRFRQFVQAAAKAAIRHDGSLSGEHGDGRARGELLPLMYSQRAIDLFGRVKAIFDPHGVLNPGIVVDPPAFDHDLRASNTVRSLPVLGLRYSSDSGDLVQAINRCTGVGKCRSVTHGPGVVMCPSYAATGEEKDSTRGRARVLQDLMAGHVAGGWRSPIVQEALDLCLSCKGCLSDCPTGVDMASYKSEVLYQAHRSRVRPRSHYTLGRLPLWARLTSRWPRLGNSLLAVPGARRVLLALAGVDRRRSIPSLPARSFRRTARRSQSATGDRRVILFVDSFTNYFSPDIGHAALAVLEAAGYWAELSRPGTCCGLTWLSTGQLDAGRKRLERTVAALLPAVQAGAVIVGIEPSCTAVLRHDAVELLGTQAARDVAAATRTLAELLAKTPGWSAPDLTGLRVVAQPHCHHHAVMGWEADARLLREAGAEVMELGGCCGLAGNWGMEVGHYEVSVAIAGQQLLPALRDATPEHLVLADGFSCRTQISDLTSHRSHHLAELLASRLPNEPSSQRRP